MNHWFIAQIACLLVKKTSPNIGEVFCFFLILPINEEGASILTEKPVFISSGGRINMLATKFPPSRADTGSCAM